MKIKNELRTAFQLLGLLCLLFWSFTWNIPKGFDFSKPKESLKSTPENYLKGAHDSKRLNKRTLFRESLKSGKYFEANTGSFLPPFNVWKEVELRKQEVKDVRDKIPVAKVPRRKLNYASAKCGAKILSSNRESRHRISILNEKVDEYMLNPCGIKVWFIVELCDTIEASQVELANYELYSSVPKDFSIFWSNVYPTQTWNLLGTFQAKNERTMQTFNINFQNLGKFIKVVISSHYGKEHFCPLSVFRVVGYSMVYEYDVIDQGKEEKKTKNDSKINAAGSVLPEEPFTSSKVYSSIKQISSEVKQDSNLKDDIYPINLCQMLQKHCSTSRLQNTCRDKPICVFLKIAIFKDESLCDICTAESESATKISSRNFWTNIRPDTKDKLENTRIEKANIKNLRSQNLHKSKSNTRMLNEQGLNSSGDKLNGSVEQSYPGMKSQISAVKNTSDRSFLHNKAISQTGGKFPGNIREPREKEVSPSVNRCDCSKDLHEVERITPKQNSSSEASQFEQDVADSAALIQKESVLVKMNVRIKTLETNLSLINRYLQHLSESYRTQVEDMLSMFDGTIKAITMTSAKAAIVDKQQQLIIDQLDRKVNILTMKVQHLGNGQKGILKQVFELHGFFLILEIIIMSTVFSVFFNKFKRDVLV